VSIGVIGGWGAATRGKTTSNPGAESRGVGIDLGDIVVRRPAAMADYAGKRVAFDAWNVLYQFLSSIRAPDGTPLKDAEGRVTSHLAGALYRTANLVEAGIRPAFVFDGEPHPLKRETLAGRAARKVEAEAHRALAEADRDAARAEGDEAGAEEAEGRMRTKAQQTSRLDLPMVQETMALFRALGVPVLQAPGEGEAQGAWMARQGLVHAVCSQDYDAVLFGAPRLVRNLSVVGRRKLPGKQVWVDAQPEEIGLEESLAASGLTRERLVDVALLVGTDFHPGIRGIGSKKALALVKKEGSLEALLDRLAANPSSASSAVERAILEQHEALADRDAVRRIFLEPAHVAVDPGDLEMRAPDPPAVRRLMVDGHGFSPERVDTALERFGAARKKTGQKTLF
jgi:flap endonuclease-1